MSYRSDIHDEIVSILGNISKTNGYVNNINLVTKKIEDIETLSTFPTLSVIAGSQSYQIIDEQEKLYSVKSSFVVIGYVKSDTDTNNGAILSQDCDDLLNDIKQCILLNDETIFDNTEALEIKLQNDTAIYDFDNNIATVMLSFEATYNEVGILPN